MAPCGVFNLIHFAFSGGRMVWEQVNAWKWDLGKQHGSLDWACRYLAMPGWNMHTEYDRLAE